MAIVFLPAVLRPLAGGASQVALEGATLRALVTALEAAHPALAGRIVRDGDVVPEVFLAVNGVESFGLDDSVSPADEVHIMPAMAGG